MVNYISGLKMLWFELTESFTIYFAVESSQSKWALKRTRRFKKKMNLPCEVQRNVMVSLQLHIKINHICSFFTSPKSKSASSLLVRNIFPFTRILLNKYFRISDAFLKPSNVCYTNGEKVFPLSNIGDVESWVNLPRLPPIPNHGQSLRFPKSQPPNPDLAWYIFLRVFVHVRLKSKLEKKHCPFPLKFWDIFKSIFLHEMHKLIKLIFCYYIY